MVVPEHRIVKYDVTLRHVEVWVKVVRQVVVRPSHIRLYSMRQMSRGLRKVMIVAKVVKLDPKVEDLKRTS